MKEGKVKMEPKSVVLVITSKCSHEVDEEYNAWLDDTHFPMLLEFKGLKRIAKYKLVAEREVYLPGSLTNALAYSEYMFILEFDSRHDLEAYEASPEFAAAIEEAATHDWHGLCEKRQRAEYKLIRYW